MRSLHLALAAAAFAATVSVACGIGNKAAQPSGTEPAVTAAPVHTGAWTAPRGTPVLRPDWRTIRFLDVTVSTPEEIIAYPMGGYTSLPARPYHQPKLIIEPRGVDHVRILIDAKTGAMIRKAGSEQFLAGLQVALDTVRVSPFDPRTAPWPYADTLPPDRRGGWGSVTYPQPDPLSGISVGGGMIADGGPPGVCNTSFSVSNGQSMMIVNGCTGEPYSQGMHIDPVDADAFDRFLKAIKVKP